MCHTHIDTHIFLKQSIYLFSHLELFTGEHKSSNVGIIVGATVGGSVLLVLLICAGLYAFHQKKRAEKAVSQSNPFGKQLGFKAKNSQVNSFNI